MGYSKIDVTSASLRDIQSGSLVKVKGGFTTNPGLDWAFANEPTAVYLGECGDSGISLEFSADSNEKKTMDRSHGAVYSNFLGTITFPFASAADRDVLGTAFGDGNVTTVAGGTKVLFALDEQPTDDGYIVLGKTDDGRKLYLVITAGQTDPNISFTLVNTEITVYETNVLVSSGNAYMLIEDAQSVSA